MSGYIHILLYCISSILMLRGSMEYVVLIPVDGLTAQNEIEKREIIARELIVSLTLLYPDYNFISLIDYGTKRDIEFRSNFEKTLYTRTIRKEIDKFKVTNIIIDFIINNGVLMLTFTGVKNAFRY